MCHTSQTAVAAAAGQRVAIYCLKLVTTTARFTNCTATTATEGKRRGGEEEEAGNCTVVCVCVSGDIYTDSDTSKLLHVVCFSFSNVCFMLKCSARFSACTTTCEQEREKER